MVGYVLLCLCCLLVPSWGEGREWLVWKRYYQNSKKTHQNLEELLEVLKNNTVPDFTMQGDVHQFHTFKYQFERALGFPYSMTSYDPSINTVSFAYPDLAFQIKYTFWWDYSFIGVLPFSGFGYVALEAVNATFTVTYTKDNVVVPRLLCGWKFPDFVLHNPIAALVGADEAMRRLFESSEGWAAHASKHISSLMKDKLSPILTSKYRARTLSVLGLPSPLVLTHILSTARVREDYEELRYNLQSRGSTKTNNDPNSSTASDPSGVYTYSYGTLCQLMVQIAMHLGTLTFRDGHLPSDLLVRLDAKTFAQVLPDMRIVPDAVQNLLEAAVVARESKPSLEVELSKGIVTITGIGFAAEIKDATNRTVLQTQFVLTIQVKVTGNDCQDKRALLMGELLTVEVQVESATSEVYPTVVHEGMEHVLRLFLREYVMPVYGTRVFGEGIVLLTNPLIQKCQFSLHNEGIRLETTG